MAAKVTIVISPRDRYSGLEQCIEEIYRVTDPALFQLVVLDLGYPRKIIKNVEAILSNKSNGEILRLGRMIPMDGMRRVRERIDTPFTFFIDNDSRVTEGWIEPLIETAESSGAAVVSPLVLEKEGVDEGADLRNHIFTSEIRVVDVENKPYLIEFKPFRRALPTEIPNEITPTQMFELHGVMFNTEKLKSIQLPQMVIREHIDIGMQLHASGEKLVAEPRSVILFDNLGTRMNLSDMRYFNYRWAKRWTSRSSRLFEARWGYNFYSEQSIYNWVVRRRMFLIFRYFYIPVAISNKLVSVFNKLKTTLIPVWDPKSDPIGESVLLYSTLEDSKPIQKCHQAE